MNEYLLVLLNAIAYIAMFIWYYKRMKCINAGIFLLLVWGCSAVGSVLYEPVNFVGHNNEIALVPYVYLFIANFIMFYPVLCFRSDLLRSITINKRVFKALCLGLLILSILPFFENFLYAIGHMNQKGMEQLQMLMNERYEDASITYAYLSKPALICTRLLGFIGVNIIALMLVLFPLVLSIKQHKWLFAGLVITNVNYILEGINIFARFKIIIVLMMIVFVFVIFRNFYEKGLRKILFRYAIISFGAITVLFTIMTIYRLSNFQEDRGMYDISMFAYVGQYASESMGNFNANMWPVDKQTDIDRFKYAFVRFFTNVRRDKQAESFYLGYNSGLFYTAVGDYVRAYGKYVAMIIVLVSSFIFTRIFKNKRSMTLGSILLFLLYARVPLLGFTYNTYAVSGDEFLFSLFFIPLLLVYEKYGKSIIIKTQQ